MDDLMETNISESVTNLILLLDAADFQFCYLQDCVHKEDEKEGDSILKMRTQLQYLSLLETIICKQCRICR